jgi:predicted nuclease of restriction endonuclease-like (RecB) superfamily
MRLDESLNFNSLVYAIKDAHEQLYARATKAVNMSLTLRNWLIGFYISEYEMGGSDRAAYGNRLIEELSRKLAEKGMNRVSERELRRFRQFYLAYPQIREAVTPELSMMLPNAISDTGNREAATPEFETDGKKLLENLSFTHLDELTKIEDTMKRYFYEMECIRGYWSARELKRQIASLYYERSGLSKDKKKLAGLVKTKAETDSPTLAIRDPYVFDFLGIRPLEIMGESELEDSLLDKLQDFLLELGHGFCFEARQKRILIGGDNFFVDLVFYHRILKCHVLIELKLEDFKHEHIGQLKTYVSWYRKNEMSDGDNPPVGILLCTRKNNALVEYALADMDNQLFVSKYQLTLPKKEDMQRFLEGQIRAGRE